MTIKVAKTRPNALIPVRASDGAVGFDLYASAVLDPVTKDFISDLPVTIPPGGAVLIGIGIILEIPPGLKGGLYPRSGLASKYRIVVGNGPGTIDPDFRGEAGILLWNTGIEPFTVEPGMRIAQLIFTRVETPTLVTVEIGKLTVTHRGTRGFGSTGLSGIGFGTDEYDERIQRMDRYYMEVAIAASKRSMCVRGVQRIGGQYERGEDGDLLGQTRRFGCVIVKDDNIIAQGFNDQYFGSLRCVDVGCLREEKGIPSGTQIEICRAIHAEQMAILNLARGGGIGKDATLYTNTEPCTLCAKLITTLGLEAVVMLGGVYPTNGTEILGEAGIDIRYVKL